MSIQQAETINIFSKQHIFAPFIKLSLLRSSYKYFKIQWKSLKVITLL
jgi:hypothetical protein